MSTKVSKNVSKKVSTRESEKKGLKHTDKVALKVFFIIKNIAICTEQRMRFFQNTQKTPEIDFCKIMVLREIPLSLGGVNF